MLQHKSTKTIRRISDRAARGRRQKATWEFITSRLTSNWYEKVSLTIIGHQVWERPAGLFKPELLAIGVSSFLARILASHFLDPGQFCGKLISIPFHL
jgi:hypothetical protein